jgi:hypothetical protein
MNSETSRIADQLRRAFDGDAWHGPSVRELLDGVGAQQAADHLIPSAHSIWELVLHMDAWVTAAFDTIEGVPMAKIVGTPNDWPSVSDRSDTAWKQATDDLFKGAEELARAIEMLPDQKLQEMVPGREYNFYHLFHGIVQHSLYHSGQIAVLKKSGV